jgi:hypothetical protein
MSDEPTSPQPPTTSVSPSSPPSGGSPWQQGLNRLLAGGMTAWTFTKIVETDGWTSGQILGTVIVLAWIAPEVALRLLDRLRSK